MVLTNNLGSFSADGIYTLYVSVTSTQQNNIYFRGLSGNSFNGSITNISVKEVGQDWTFVGDFKIGNNQSLITNASQYSQITGSTFLTANRLYKLSANIPTLSISNALAYRVTGGAVTPISTSQVVNGKFETEFIMPSNGYLWFQTTGSYTGLNATITNISVVEITDDTNLPRINYEGFSYQDSLGSEEVVNGDFSDGINSWSSHYNATISVVNGQLEITSSATGSGRSAQGITTTIGASYLLKATITNVNSSGIAIKISQNSNLDGAYFNSASNTTTTPVEVTHTFIATSTTTYIGTNQSGSAYSTAFLDNVSSKRVFRSRSSSR